MHGIQIRGNHYVVEDNEIHNNGLSGMPGTSGVHVYAPDDSEGTGRFNRISRNRVSHQHDSDGWDGNGIQADHWTGDNEISDNEIFDNDGSGISLHDSDRNLITGNTLYRNSLNPGFTRDEEADLALSTRNEAVARTEGNTVSGNTIVATNPRRPRDPARRGHFRAAQSRG